MADNLPLSLKVGRLPLNFQDKPVNLFRAMIKRMKGGVDGSRIIIGLRNSIVEPAGDIGLWKNGRAFLAWRPSVGEYRYVPVKDENSGFTATLDAHDLTDDRLQPFFPLGRADKSGTIATLINVFIPRDPILIDGSAGAFAIDGNQSDNFYGQLKSNAGFIAFTILENQTVSIGILNPASWTLSWSGTTVKWPLGAPPVVPVSGPGGIGYMKAYVTNVNGTLYGEFCYAKGSPTGTAITTDPRKNYGGAGNSGLSKPVNHLHNLP